MADPDWRDGRYFERKAPIRIAGSAVARMAAHITYLSDAALHRKFGRRMQDRELPTFSFDADFQVESYLRYQGSSFVERFDANSYLYLTRAMDYFDIAADHDGVLAQAFRGIKTRFCVVSFTTDWLFPTSESRALVHALNASSARVSFAEIETDRGHDAFLLDVPEFFDISRAFLQSAGKARGLDSGRWLRWRFRNRPCRSAASRPIAPGKYRTDHLLVAEMIEPAQKCSTSAAATAICCNCWRAAASTAAASNCRARASTAASPRGSPWCRATPTPTSSTIPTMPSTT